MSAIINSGFILGPGFGALAEISHRLPFYVAGTLGVVAFIMSVLLIHNPQKQLQMDSTNINLNYSLKLMESIYYSSHINTCISIWFICF